MPRADANLVYKIAGRAEWAAAAAAGVYTGSADDRRDGYIHLSTATQLAGTARKHFAGRADLVLIAVDAAVLGAQLAWQPSRDGMLFPHLHAPLPVSAVAWVRPLPLAADGVHVVQPEVS